MVGGSVGLAVVGQEDIDGAAEIVVGLVDGASDSVIHLKPIGSELQ